MKRRARLIRPLQAFSLVEVVLALGILAVALTSLIGLLTVGLNNNRHSDQETFLAAMAWRVCSGLRGATNGPSLVEVADTVSYFDAQGQPTTSGPSAYYQCQVVLAKTNVLDPANPNMTLASLKFVSPGATNVLHATLPFAY